MIGGTGVPNSPMIDPGPLLGLEAKANPNTAVDNTNTVMLLTLGLITFTAIVGNVCIAIFKEGDILGLISAVSAISVLVATALIALLKQGQELHKTVNSRMGEMIQYVQALASANATLAAKKEAAEEAAVLAEQNRKILQETVEKAANAASAAQAAAALVAATSASAATALATPASVLGVPSGPIDVTVINSDPVPVVQVDPVKKE